MTVARYFRVKGDSTVPRTLWERPEPAGGRVALRGLRHCSLLPLLQVSRGPEDSGSKKAKSACLRGGRQGRAPRRSAPIDF